MLSVAYMWAIRTDLQGIFGAKAAKCDDLSSMRDYHSMGFIALRLLKIFQRAVFHESC